MRLLDIAGLILGIAAIASWVNARMLKFPPAVGLLVLGMIISLGIGALDQVAPSLGVGSIYSGLLHQVDYSDLVLNFMLAYLLFAGAMNVDLVALRRRAWSTTALSLISTLITAILSALALFTVAAAAGRPIGLAWAFVFGALISPTDPIAVLAMTRRVALAPEVRAQLEGESLFNDGVAVVLFRASLAFAVSHVGGGSIITLAGHGAIEALAGALIGALGGTLAILIIRAVDDWPTETLVTLATATVVYAASQKLGVSGPIGVVVAGLIAGSPLAERNMSDLTRRHIHPFWRVVDEGLNAILFLGLGLKIWDLRGASSDALVAICAPALIVVARLVSIAAPAAIIRPFGAQVGPRLIAFLSWAGVRGGLSVAMSLSIPPSPEQRMILAATMAVAIFSVVVQSATIERVALWAGVGRART